MRWDDDTTSTSRLGLVCAVLTGVTLLSWWIGINDGLHAFSPERRDHRSARGSDGGIESAADRLGVHGTPACARKLRRIADATLAGLIGALLLLYFVGLNLQTYGSFTFRSGPGYIGAVRPRAFGQYRGSAPSRSSP